MVPELPEMQALAERLDAAVAGAPFAGAVAYQFSALKTVVPGPDDLIGRVLSAVGRRGKFLVFEFAGDGEPGPGPRSEGRSGPGPRSEGRSGPGRWPSTASRCRNLRVRSSRNRRAMPER